MFVVRKELEKWDRKVFSIHYLFDQQQYGKEFRVFDLGRYLVDKWVTIRKEADDIDVSQYKKYSKVNIVNAVLTCVQLIGLYLIFLISIFRKNFPVGDLSIGLSASFQLSDKLKSTVDAYLNLYERSMYIDEMNTFFHRPNRIASSGTLTPVFDENSEIEFKDVSFKYPGSESYALRHLNLKIRADERLCIVGQNGGGKSTFIKLLTRLYLPCEGEITLNGRNINDYDLRLYQRLFAPVFQDFVQYDFSAKENIILNSPEDPERLQNVIRETGLEELFKKLPKGVHTQVGKYLDPEGFEPSGGESQRMAIARALYRGGEVFLLDEPTAALDPLQEYEIYTQFSRMIKGKCAVLITHRLSAVQLADKVAVFDNGHVAEYAHIRSFMPRVVFIPRCSTNRLSSIATARVRTRRRLYENACCKDHVTGKQSESEKRCGEIASSLHTENLVRRDRVKATKRRLCAERLPVRRNCSEEPAAGNPHRRACRENAPDTILRQKSVQSYARDALRAAHGSPCEKNI